jgi:hypothetical protein
LRRLEAAEKRGMVELLKAASKRMEEPVVVQPNIRITINELDGTTEHLEPNS